MLHGALVGPPGEIPPVAKVDVPRPAKRGKAKADPADGKSGAAKRSKHRRNVAL
jgi:hypothetical protein